MTKKIIIIFILLVLIPIGTFAQRWVTDPANCGTTYAGQTCAETGEVVCGYDSGETALYCSDPSLLIAPSSTGYSNNINYNCSDTNCDGGYVVNCASYDGTSPYCDNNGNFWCDRNSGCSNNHRKTICTNNKWAYQSGSYSCGEGEEGCLTNYHDCDANNGDCEIHDGESCTHTDSSLTGVCDGCGSTGTDSEGNSCKCVIAKSYFETGTNAEYSSGTGVPFLWGTQYGDGPLMQLFKYNSGQQQTDTVFLIDNDGCFGVGSADPVAMLDVSGQIHVGAYSGNNNAVPKSYVDDCCSGAGSYWTQSENDIYYNSGNVGIGTANPSTMFHVCGQGQFTDINMLECNGVGSRNITNVNKLTVNTIDPIHEIDGEEYATFVSFYAGGQKMETSGVLQLKAQTQNNYQYIIDFNNLDVASDLWLFWKTIHKDLDEISVILTPGFDGRVWYKKIGDSKIIIYSDQVALSSEDLERDLEVSYILFAPRYDYKKWPNLIHKSGQSKK